MPVSSTIRRASARSRACWRTYWRRGFSHRNSSQAAATIEYSRIARDTATEPRPSRLLRPQADHVVEQLDRCLHRRQQIALEHALALDQQEPEHQQARQRDQQVAPERARRLGISLDVEVAAPHQQPAPAAAATPMPPPGRGP